MVCALEFSQVKTVYRLEIRNNSYYVMDDSEEVSPYPKHCFMDISEWRDKQIEKVINAFL